MRHTKSLLLRIFRITRCYEALGGRTWSWHTWRGEGCMCLRTPLQVWIKLPPVWGKQCLTNTSRSHRRDDQANHMVVASQILCVPSSMKSTQTYRNSVRPNSPSAMASKTIVGFFALELSRPGNGTVLQGPMLAVPDSDASWAPTFCINSHNALQISLRRIPKILLSKTIHNFFRE